MERLHPPSPKAMAGQASKASRFLWRCPGFIALRRGKEEKLRFWVKSFCWHKSVKWSRACHGVARKGVDGRLRSPFFLLFKNAFLGLPSFSFRLSRIFAKKTAAGNFIFPRHSEWRFDLKNSEFRCEIKFWKSLHFQSEKLRMCSKKNKRKLTRAAKIFHS